MSKYDFEIVNYIDFVNEIKYLRSGMKIVYPTHEPKYLESLARIRKVNIILIYEKKEPLYYVPLYVSKFKHLLNSAILEMPSEVLVEDYREMFQSLYLFIRRKYSFTNFTFNYLDTHLHTSSNILSNNRAIKSEFATNVVDGSWKLSLGVRRNLKKAEKNNLSVIANPSKSHIYEFYEQCILNSRARKGIYMHNVNEQDTMLRFYDELIQSSIGKLILIADESDAVVGGSFIVFNDIVCTYYNAGNSPSGLKMGASYLSVYTGIKFALERGIEYDLFGSYINRDENYKKLHSFKSQWGREIPLDQYYVPSNFFISLPLQRRLNTNSS